MQHHLIDIDIHNGFRAIKEAHVHIDGISVISGINGSGKSTISKLLYTTFKNALQYENIVVDIINEKLMPYSDALTQNADANVSKYYCVASSSIPMASS